MSSTTETIAPALPPWTLKGTVYSFFTYFTSADVAALASEKNFLYSSLEGGSSFTQGKFHGGLGMIQIIRYSESPVGPYDEFLIVPGTYEYDFPTKLKDGTSSVTRKKNLRLTRIYVSQKHTCYNGRKNWNIPKHLARFTFSNLADGNTQISVRPYEEGATVEPSLSTPPFFTAKFRPFSYLPGIPSSTNIAKYIGLDLTLVQPPLPEGKSGFGELTGTKEWCSIVPAIHSNSTRMGWWDMKQNTSEEDPLLAENSGSQAKAVNGNYEYWWPRSGRWRFGAVMENATIEFPDGVHWEGPN